eukprot:ANDGO_06937.mRNA.1 Exportin-6
MSANDILVLENLLGEFYNSQVTPQRRKDLESTFATIQNQSDPRSLAVSLLRSNSSSPFLYFFAVSVISKKISNMKADDILFLQDEVFRMVVSPPNSAVQQQFVVNKFVQVLCMLIKAQGAQASNLYGERIMDLLADKNLTSIGILIVGELQFYNDDVLTAFRTMLAEKRHVEALLDCIGKCRITHPTIVQAIYDICLCPSDVDAPSAILCLAELSIPVDVRFLTQLLEKSTTLSADASFEEYTSQVIRLFNMFSRVGLQYVHGDMAFLSAAFQFTFSHTCNSDSLITCLDFWNQWLDSIRLDLRLAPAYRDVCLSLVQSIIRCMLQTQSPGLFADLDDSERDFFNETARDSFLRSCAESIDNVADLFPQDCLNIVTAAMNPFQQQLQANSTNVLSVSLCQDVVSILKIIQQVAILTSGEYFSERFLDSASMVQSLLQILQSCFSLQLFRMHAPGLKVSLETLSAVSSFCPWMERFRSVAYDSTNASEFVTPRNFELLTSAVFDTCLSSLDPKNCAPTDLIESSLKVFRVMCTQVRPPNLSKYSSVSLLLSNVSVLCASQSSIPVSVQQIVVSIMAHALLVADGADLAKESGNASVLERAQAFSQSISHVIVSPLLNLLQDGSFRDEHSMTEGLRLLSLVESIAAFSKSKNSPLKARILQSLHPLLSPLLELVKNNTGNFVVFDKIFDVFNSIIESLRRAIGNEYVEKCVFVFLNFFSSPVFAQLFQYHANDCTRLLVKLLRLLTSMLRDGSGAYHAFIDNIVKFSLDIVYPRISDFAALRGDMLDVGMEFFGLLYTILADNWRYFFDMQSNCAFKSESAAFVVRTILELMLSALNSRELAMFDVNLSHLAELNKSKLLFERSFFVEQFQSRFLVSLLSALVSQDVALRKDNILVAIFEIAQAVHFQNFREYFIGNVCPQVVPSLSSSDLNNLLSLLSSDVDLPTFSASVEKIANQLRSLAKPL